MSASLAAAPDDEQRPLAVLLVYSWDMLRALLALVAALAAFGGGIEVRGQVVAVPTYAQVIAAVSNAAFAASLIIVAVVLTRRQRWVRDVQVASLILAIVLIAASLAAARITDPVAYIWAAIFMVLDVMAIVGMTGPRVRQWYSGPGRVPVYVSGALVLWAAVNATLLVYEAVAVS